MRIAETLERLPGDVQLGEKALWRASIAAQLDDRPGAIELLRRAFADGLQYNVSIHSDVDLAPLWNEPAFQELMRPKGS